MRPADNVRQREPAVPGDEAATLRAECERLGELVARQAREVATLNASLEQQVAERTAELRRTTELLVAANREIHEGLVATVQVFASLVQAGTRDTVSVRKIAALAQATAEAIGLSDSQQRDVHLAGLLCDLGKLTLPDALVRTPVADMTDEEAAEFKRHTVTAERILLPLKPLARVATILRSHNERLDGHGYPDGLKGDSIPLESRVLHVVKDYDALTRRLLVRDALTPAEAVRYLQDHVGTWYDSGVVAAFRRVLRASWQQDNLRELRVSVAGLEPGMKVTRDFVNEHGVLVVTSGHRLDGRSIAALQRIVDGAEGVLLYVERQ